MNGGRWWCCSPTAGATGGPDPLGRSRIAAVRLAAEGAAAVVVDCETSYVKLGLAADLAGHLRAPVLRLEHLHADHLTAAVLAGGLMPAP